MIVTFCGHAQFTKTKEIEGRLLALLHQKIGDHPVKFYLGDYGAFDAFAYDCCKEYRRSHPNVSLVFVTPYVTIGYRRNDLRYWKGRYDEIIYPEIEDKPSKWAILYRNQWMVEQSDCVICGITHDWGGAYKTYQYAKRKNKEIFNVADAVLDPLHE